MENLFVGERPCELKFKVGTIQVDQVINTKVRQKCLLKVPKVFNFVLAVKM